MNKRPSAAQQATHWQRTRRLTALLLGAWFSTFGIIFFARELSTIELFGWPLSFYMAAQGTILIYLAIVAIYAWRMRQLDNQLKDEDPHAG
jgi:putative solute:sodium symporter small subunit